MPLSTPISTSVAAGTTRSARWRTSGSPPAAANVDSWALPQNRPMRSLVRFLIAARLRRLPSYDELRPAPDRPQVGERLVEHGVVDAGQVPGPHRRPEGVAVEAGEVEPAGDDAVLDVVDRVGDVVGEVHHLRLQAAAARRRSPSRSQSKTGRSSS